MPQFDPSQFPPQIFWLVISFVALYWLMSKVALPRIKDVLEEREFRINDNLRKAENLKKDAEDAMAAYEKLMADARVRAQEQVNAVRERALADAHERHAELSERLAAEIAAAEARIAATRDDAVAGMREMALEAAGLAVERLIGERPATDAVASSVDRIMKGA
jgi:F-type H+-transporting ATPase subunit b